MCNYNRAPFGGSGSSAIKATKYVEGMAPHSHKRKAQSVLYALRLILYELPMKYLELNPKGDERFDLLNYHHLFIVKNLGMFCRLQNVPVLNFFFLIGYLKH